MTDESELERGLKGIDEHKRRTLVRLGLGAAFVAPIVASFSMDGLTISKVHAASAHGSGVVTEKPPERHHMHPNSTYPNSTSIE
jgi:hypothetical protein